MAFSLVLHGTVPKDEICGVIVGHSEYLSLTRWAASNRQPERPDKVADLFPVFLSLVLLQRCLSVFTWRSAAPRSAAVLEESV